MKSLLRLTLLTVVLALGCSATSFAQKFGYIDTEAVISALPEIEEVQTNLETISKDLDETYESMHVEFNNKLNNYTQEIEKLSDAVKKIKEEEIQTLRQRISEFQQVAEQSFQEEYTKLMQPLYEKTKEAIDKVSKANSFTLVFELRSQALSYFDENSVVDITPLVKKELGI